MSRDVHPSPTARRGERVGITSRFKCKQCGFPVDANKRSKENPEDVSDGNVVSGTGTDITITTNQGCPFCGTFNWSRQATKVKAPSVKGPRLGLKVKRYYPRRYERF